jgi:hypothetical protein
MLRTAINHHIARINRLRDRRTPARAVKPRSASDRSDDSGGFAIAGGTLAAA